MSSLQLVLRTIEFLEMTAEQANFCVPLLTKHPLFEPPGSSVSLTGQPSPSSNSPCVSFAVSSVLYPKGQRQSSSQSMPHSLRHVTRWSIRHTHSGTLHAGQYGYLRVELIQLLALLPPAFGSFVPQSGGLVHDLFGFICFALFLVQKAQVEQRVRQVSSADTTLKNGFGPQE